MGGEYVRMCGALYRIDVAVGPHRILSRGGDECNGGGDRGEHFR